MAAPFAPAACRRVMNVIARLLLRTRGYASFFFIVAVATVFYINVNRWASMVPGWQCRA